MWHVCTGRVLLHSGSGFINFVFGIVIYLGRTTWNFFLFSPRFLKEEFTFFEIVFFFFPYLLDLPPGIDKNSEVPAEGSFGWCKFVHRGRTAMGELLNTKAPVRDPGILSNSRRLVHCVGEDKITTVSKTRTLPLSLKLNGITLYNKHLLLLLYLSE